MDNIIAFADEFGTNSFDFETQSTHFIVASIIVEKEKLMEFEKQLESIRNKYFQTGEIKSNKVGKKHKRRLIILNKLIELDFNIYAVVVDKTKLYSEGFRYKKSFYKSINGLLYKELFKTYPKLELIVDEHGRNKFMKSFKKYVENNHIRNLFSNADFYIENSKNNIGVQLADFIAGTLGYIFDKHKKNSYSDQFYEILKKKLISINYFPPEYENYEIDDQSYYNEYDPIVARISMTNILDYLDRIKGNTQNNIDRIRFLKLLLLYNHSQHPKKYTTANEFIKHLNINRKKELSKEQFTRQIIGHLRDKGILIASSRNGYKIPSNVIELKKFINHGKSIIIPMLRRIKKTREALLLATKNEFDILDGIEFKKIKKILDNAG